MTFYTRPQLAVLLALVAAAGLGLAVGRWRAAHPDAVERLETFDRAGAPEAPAAARDVKQPRAVADDAGARDARQPRATAGESAARDATEPRPVDGDAAAREAGRPSATDSMRREAWRPPAPTENPATDAGARAPGRRSSPRRSASPPSAVDGPPAPLDINEATEDQLLQLPGVGPVLASRILAARATGGGFGGVDDLRRVPGLGRARLDVLRRLLIVAP